jgi:type II secretory pathway predicted ATPase ExeA
MLKDFFGLTGNPFTKDIPCKFLFPSESQREALGRLHYAIEERQFVVLTGDCGTGKTTVLRSLYDSLDMNKYDTLYLTESKLTPRNFYKGLLDQLGRDTSFSRGDSRIKLHEQIEYINCVKNRELILVIDEAHLLGRTMLEEIRFLLNFKMDSVSPLTLVLSGQPELLQNLDMRSSSAIRQRIDLRYRLLPLDGNETEAYIEHHLKIVGITDEIFGREAKNEIFSFSAGVVRIINKVCLHCMLLAASKKIKRIDENIVRTVIECEMK